MKAYSEFSDPKLAERLQLGDHAAFAEIYNRFFGLLYIHAYRRLNDQAEANDLIQELFTALWDKRAAFQLTGSLSSYLYAAVRNRILNVIEHKTVSDRYMRSLASYTDQDHQLADHTIREKDLSTLIEKEIDALPSTMRKIFILSRREHLSYKEIALSLDMSEQSVKSHMKRALKILRIKLGLSTYLICLLKFL